MKLVLSRHAQDMMVDQGVTRAQVERAIRRGSKFTQSEGLLAVYGYVRVAYRVVGDVHIVKTVMVEGPR